MTRMSPSHSKFVLLLFIIRWTHRAHSLIAQPLASGHWYVAVTDAPKIKTSPGLPTRAAQTDTEGSVRGVDEERFVTTSTLDPTLSGVLLRVAGNDDDYGSRAGWNLSFMMQASKGLQAWRTVLLHGRLPFQNDFDRGDVWPVEPLFARISQVMIDLQLPRFVLRHPEMVSAVLLSVLRYAVEFHRQCQLTDVQSDDKDEEDNVEPFNYSLERNEPRTPEELDALADEIAGGFLDQWEGVVSGMNSLDQLFGAHHGLLDVEQDSDVDGSVAKGFGLSDGIWHHNGWSIMPELQRQLASMPELRDLVKALGRRSTAEISDSITKFVPRKDYPDGALGARYEPSMRTSVNGLTLSNSLSEMLLSEAVLLRGSPALRRLFLANKIESKLLSYEMSGFADKPSIPRQRARSLVRMPSAPGGPLVVCLDTSWSMTGSRERLAKAVVLECVSAAHKQRRDCFVMAFSTENNVMEAGLFRADTNGIRRLLDFLQGSFGGGTDVTGALKHAILRLGTDDLSSADLLLITDGEIPDPPVSTEVMEILDRLKQRTGLEVHGLLVGRSESKPLESLCTETHDFLSGCDSLLSTTFPSRTGRTTQPASSLRGRPKTSLNALFSRRDVSGFSLPVYQGFGSSRLDKTSLKAKYVDEDEQTTRKGRPSKRGGGQKRRLDDEDQLWEDLAEGTDYTIREIVEVVAPESSSTDDSFESRVDNAMAKLLSTVTSKLQEKQWNAIVLYIEKERNGSCWPYRDELQAAVERMSENLVERDQEARLVVLAMISLEHILLLGPPGTGKSVLGRRLSTLCGGYFFQRLLTRFTTPEEIFGPLSLTALENDEYKRCTAGFLPTASVAFLDEIFKANSAILNTLLTILNERQFDNGAGARETCPIRCVVGASNELPESDELDALYDRFLLRKDVTAVSDEGIMRLLSMASPGSSTCDDASGSDSGAECDNVFVHGLDDVIQALSEAADTVEMTEDACALLRDLRTYMREELNEGISDRRLVKAAKLLKISAASNGRARVDPLDCLLLQHVVWRLPEQHGDVQTWLWDNVTPAGTMGQEPTQFRFVLDSLRQEAKDVVRRTSGDLTGASGARPADVAAIKSLRTDVSRLVTLLQQSLSSLARHMELLKRSTDHLWLDPNEAKAAQQLVLPKAESLSIQVGKALADALALELTLSEAPTSPRDDLRLSVIESLWDEGIQVEMIFSTEELSLGMREAKAKYDTDTFRAWKRARRKANK